MNAALPLGLGTVHYVLLWYACHLYVGLGRCVCWLLQGSVRIVMRHMEFTRC